MKVKLVRIGIEIAVAFPFAAINALPSSVTSDIIQKDSIENKVNREGIFAAGFSLLSQIFFILYDEKPVTQYFKEHGIFFDTVLDEGGAILSGQIPGVTARSAMIAVHEKGRHMYKCTASDQENGHSGFGKPGDTPVMRMSKFITEVSAWVS